MVPRLGNKSRFQQSTATNILDFSALKYASIFKTKKRPRWWEPLFVWDSQLKYLADLNAERLSSSEVSFTDAVEQ